MPINSLDGIFEAFRKLKVLVIGDAMLDAYIYGDVRRVSPEAPVPVVSVERREKRLGGAANVALNIQSLGAMPILCSVVGDDQDGNDFMQLLRQHDLPGKGIIQSSHRITTVKYRILSASQHLLRIDSEEDKPLNELERKTLINHIEDLIGEVDLIIFEDYDKGCLSEIIISRAINLAGERGIPTVVDPKKRNFLSYNRCTLFKPNLSELSAGTGKNIAPDQEEIKSVVGPFMGAMEVENMLVTLSKEGIYFQNSVEHGLFKSYARSISDNSGAGDTVISIAGLGLAIGLPLSFIAEFANLGGGIVCESQGVIPIAMERLKEEASQSQILLGFLAN